VLLYLPSLQHLAIGDELIKVAKQPGHSLLTIYARGEIYFKIGTATGLAPFKVLFQRS